MVEMLFFLYFFGYSCPTLGDFLWCKLTYGEFAIVISSILTLGNFLWLQLSYENDRKSFTDLSSFLTLGNFLWFKLLYENDTSRKDSIIRSRFLILGNFLWLKQAYENDHGKRFPSQVKHSAPREFPKVETVI